MIQTHNLQDQAPCTLEPIGQRLTLYHKERRQNNTIIQFYSLVFYSIIYYILYSEVPGFESGISHKDPLALQDHSVIL